MCIGGTLQVGGARRKYLRLHVIYAIYGRHPSMARVFAVYRKNEKVRNRLVTHASWIEDEYEEVSIRVASLGRIASWKNG